MESALRSKGQITIPKTVRDLLNLRPKDRVKFFLHPDGTVVLLPRIPTSSLKGIVSGGPEQPVSLEEMDAAIESESVKRYRKRA